MNMLRVTTNSTLYTYQKNLLKNTNQLYSAMNTMMTGRNFDSYSADPAGSHPGVQDPQLPQCHQRPGVQQYHGAQQVLHRLGRG